MCKTKDTSIYLLLFGAWAVFNCIMLVGYLTGKF